ncbi:hypothetical protein N7453_002458 [Penicillium expansum]|nr:hypothetical protein N7453_002458 [Penicillium expansum]
MTDLSLAIHFGLKQVVENILSEEHTDFNIEDESGLALSVACITGQSDIVALLLNKGANCNALHCHGQSPFIPPHFSNLHDLHGTALHTATYFGRHDIVSMLLENGADVNINGCEGPALNIASRQGNLDIILDLLKWGADVNLNPKGFPTPLAEACYRGSREIVKVLLENGADATTIRGYYDGSAINGASDYGNQGVDELVERLPKHKVDFDFLAAKGGSTALRAAASQGHREIVGLLLNHGADITMRGEGGYLNRGWRWYKGTALDAATKEGPTEIIEILAEKEAEVRSST